MKITRGECLLLVAIVTSAIVAEVREQTLPVTQAAASSQTQTTGREYPGRTLACQDAQDGMLRAACGIQGKESEQPAVDSGADAADRTPEPAINRADKARTGNVWV